MKGRVIGLEPPTEADLAAFRDHTDRFFAAVVISDGNPIEQLHRLLPAETMTVEVEVDEQFDQTPGPGAGATLRVSR
jgi:hypothetical protein